ncbi:DUF4810 domain-containing protein [Geothermobacter hydrogeniphilus]|uniref:DUF4810 domain-containing protein n=1 Tax=Geothermobacter hydrogeniphilus TaxID=1969733 RepID=A0A2K2H5X8_9BACT|nr:DUF4810 domain-containing protein [Geothermobacter hydrogeniphilus]PNU18640.1 DUF4810 domain-containing protein [Geothermobacter hydrogeniphilus]
MKKFVVMLFVAALFAGGCAPPQKPQMYCWENYSATLYDYDKNPGDETYAKHKECLLTIIEHSGKENLRVPPGVYAELGYDLVNEGKKEEGLKYLALEKETYPESAVLVDKLLAKLDEKQ